MGPTSPEYAAHSPAQETSDSVVQSDQSVGRANRAVSPPEWNVRRQSGIAYRTIEDRELLADVYIPVAESPERPSENPPAAGHAVDSFPALVAIHGGAWRSGTRLQWGRHANELARAGFVVIAIDYRLAPRDRFPAQLEDCRAAVEWAYENAERFQIDRSRIGVIGYSAGGHLAAMLGVTLAADQEQSENSRQENEDESDNKAGGVRLRAVVAGGAPTDFTTMPANSVALRYWLGSTRRDDPEVYRQASPATQVTGNEPPFYFFHGGADRVVLPAASLIMHHRLREAGVTSVHRVVPGQGHVDAFLNLDNLNPVIEFLNQHLK